MTFKIVLSGVTGRIGKQVLHQALQNPAVTSVIALSRRPLSDLAQHAKVKVLVIENFTKYPDEAIAELVGADGCIWYVLRRDHSMVALIPQGA
jgi:dihydrodipicolinate reductase